MPNPGWRVVMSALDESPAAEGRYRVLFDALPIAVYQTGADGS
jgi:hypothetical protein